MPLLEPLTAPIRSLLTIFAIRTVVLLSLAVLATFFFSSASSPYGYDTSSTHLFIDDQDLFHSFPGRLAVALSRWDAIYFVKIGERGYVWEQEWAFQSGLGVVVNALESLPLLYLNHEWDTTKRVLASSGVSTIAHVLSAIILHRITLLIFSLKTKSKSNQPANHLAFVAATLHILSPAGIFLIAPYTESLFSLLSFAGYWLYALAVYNECSQRGQTWRNDACILLAGICFGLSCLVRLNGVLNGTLLLWEALSRGVGILRAKDVANNIRKLGISGLAGIIMGVGVLWPQYLAWQEYCGGDVKRVWCSSMLPSIYTFVQDHYWNVGFLRYWTFSNLPLFALALPILITLLYTSSAVFLALAYPASWYIGLPTSLRTASPSALVVLRRLALPQLMLAMLALTNYHVQIVTRLSSGMLVWYLYVACKLIDEGLTTKVMEGDRSKNTSKPLEANVTSTSSSKWGATVVRWSIGYSLVQAVLFGSFLPPA